MLISNRAGAFCQKPAPLPLCSGSRLGRVYHHDVRVAQHHVGTLHHKQAVCALKWSPDGRLLSSGCSDGLLTIWPHDPGAKAQVQPLKVIPQSTAVKVRRPIAFQVALHSEITEDPSHVRTKPLSQCFEIFFPQNLFWILPSFSWTTTLCIAPMCQILWL